MELVETSHQDLFFASYPPIVPWRILHMDETPILLYTTIWMTILVQCSYTNIKWYCFAMLCCKPCQSFGIAIMMLLHCKVTTEFKQVLLWSHHNRWMRANIKEPWRAKSPYPSTSAKSTLCYFYLLLPISTHFASGLLDVVLNNDNVGNTMGH